MGKRNTKQVIFWGMLAAGILWLLVVLLQYFTKKHIPTKDAVLAVVLIGFAIAYKYQQKI